MSVTIICFIVDRVLVSSSAVVDPSSGNTYYYNATTGETSWTLPA
jgi:outer membrane protein assembly factor BamB